MTFADLWGDLQPILASLLLALLSWGATELTRWVRSKTKNERVAAATEILSRTVVDTVKELEQTVRPMLSDGRLSPEEGNAIKTRARDLINSKLTPVTLDLVKSNVGDLETWISGKIEASVYDMKKEVPCDIKP